MCHFRPSRTLCLVVCLYFPPPCLTGGTTLCPVIFHWQGAKQGGMVWGLGCVKGASVERRLHPSDFSAICRMCFKNPNSFKAKSILGNTVHSSCPHTGLLDWRETNIAILSWWKSSTKSNICTFPARTALSPSSHIAQTPRNLHC